jgi:hypothetical protein
VVSQRVQIDSGLALHHIAQRLDNNHIALEWLKDVSLSQTEPCDALDARLIILDGHGSHAQVSLLVFSLPSHPL